MIQKIDYNGFKAVEINTSILRMVVVYGVGPRIAVFEKNGCENLLYWNTENLSETDWNLYGGHRVWITRMSADESVDTYVPDNDECSIEITDKRLVVTAPVSPVHKLERGMDIEVISDNEIKVRNFIKNCGNLIYSCGVWSPTCVNLEGKKILVPLGDESSTWDVVKIAIPRVFAGNVSQLEDDQISFLGNTLQLTAKGRVAKRVMLAKQGLTTLDCGAYSFVKFSPYNKLLRYPFDGCNVAVFNGENNWMSEMESFGGESEVIPGETIDNVEYWKIEDK